ncbi:hypothetical protein OROMI_006237 [Orobanche minor]
MNRFSGKNGSNMGYQKLSSTESSSFKNAPVDFTPAAICSWTSRQVFKCREVVTQLNEWNDMVISGKYCVRKMYQALRGAKEKVEWRSLVMRNLARPRTVFLLWLCLLQRLPTKSTA